MIAQRPIVEQDTGDDQRAGQRSTPRLVGSRHIPGAEAAVEAKSLLPVLVGVFRRFVDGLLLSVDLDLGFGVGLAITLEARRSRRLPRRLWGIGREYDATVPSGTDARLLPHFLRK